MSYLKYINSSDLVDLLGVGLIIVLLLTSTSFVVRRILSYIISRYYIKQNSLNQDEDNYYLLCLLANAVLSYVLVWKGKDIEDFNSTYVISVIWIASFLVFILHKVDDSEEIDVVNSQSNKKSIGAAWAHNAFKGYYETIFDDWETVLKLSVTPGKQLDCKNLIIICPLSCDINGSLSEKFNNVTEVKCPEVLDDQGANINRNYKLPVYKITHGDNSIYVMAQFQSSLGTLCKVKDKMSKEFWLYHRESFIENLKELLKDRPCDILEYDDLVHDTQEDLFTFITSRLDIKKAM